MVTPTNLLRDHAGDHASALHTGGLAHKRAHDDAYLLAVNGCRHYALRGHAAHSRKFHFRSEASRMVRAKQADMSLRRSFAIIGVHGRIGFSRSFTT